ncbi:hypothetical protein evm_011151 [Chilo suppressalis]|nr:hypothetical protein evm_011151 [Chilo suppressalis]
MAPRETQKLTPKVQRTIVKTVGTKSRTPTSVLKKAMPKRQTTEKVPLKAINTVGLRQRTNTVPKASTPRPKASTPRPKENNTVPLPSSVTKSAKKASWKRRPKAAHSGVPVPEKMKKLMEKQFQDSDCSL